MNKGDGWCASVNRI